MDCLGVPGGGYSAAGRTEEHVTELSIVEKVCLGGIYDIVEELLVA